MKESFKSCPTKIIQAFNKKSKNRIEEEKKKRKEKKEIENDDAKIIKCSRKPSGPK